MNHCAWCGQFVRRDTQLTSWRVRVGYRGGPGDNQQNPRSHWNYWKRLLCPPCARVTNIGSWHQVTLAEVERRYARGWDPDRPHRMLRRAV